MLNRERQQGMKAPAQSTVEAPGNAAGQGGGRTPPPFTKGSHPANDVPRVGFLAPATASAWANHLFEEDIADVGYVTNSTRLWARMPHALDALFDLMRQAADAGHLTFRQRGILVTASASTLGDSYCSIAWGARLASVGGAVLSASVIRGVDEGLSPRERALAQWARAVVVNPNATSAADVEGLRREGFHDDAIFAITTFVALRLAFSTVNDALGIQPDQALLDAVPSVIRDAAAFGRPET